MFRPSDPPCERDLKLDSYQLWLAEKYNIRRNDVFQKFEVERRLFPNLEEALKYTHSLEMEAELKRDERNYRKLEERNRKKYIKEKCRINNKKFISRSLESGTPQIIFMSLVLFLLAIFIGF